MTTSAAAKPRIVQATRHASLRSQVQEILRASILNGELEVGEHLIERELCEATGVSRPVLREAMAHLEARGLIERVPARGFVVATPSVERVPRIYEVRAALEGLAAQCFAERASDADVQALCESCERLLEALADGSRAAIREMTTRFYDILMDRCGNPEIRIALEPILDRVAFLRSQSVSMPGRRKKSAQEMRAIIEAITRRDSARAKQASVDHISNACDAALEQLRQSADNG